MAAKLEDLKIKLNAYFDQQDPSDLFVLRLVATLYFVVNDEKAFNLLNHDYECVKALQLLAKDLVQWTNARIDILRQNPMVIQSLSCFNHHQEFALQHPALFQALNYITSSPQPLFNNSVMPLDVQDIKFNLQKTKHQGLKLVENAYLAAEQARLQRDFRQELQALQIAANQLKQINSLQPELCEINCPMKTHESLHFAKRYEQIMLQTKIAQQNLSALQGNANIDFNLNSNLKSNASLVRCVSQNSADQDDSEADNSVSNPLFLFSRLQNLDSKKASNKPTGNKLKAKV